MKVTNNTNETLDFVVPGGSVKDGVPETCSVGAGQTESLDLDTDSPQVKARIFAGAITVAGHSLEKVAENMAAPPSAGEATIETAAPPKRRGGRPRTKR
jgi:hypothetical protein